MSAPLFFSLAVLCECLVVVIYERRTTQGNHNSCLGLDVQDHACGHIVTLDVVVDVCARFMRFSSKSSSLFGTPCIFTEMTSAVASIVHLCGLLSNTTVEH